ncbi:MAG: anthranilate/aminodeoxychorismate synthase component II [Verrucomicrobia bacterium TMED56]|jgi:anthranilate synthase component 2|nr:MAG: anthranilate/aminodeoxychorismate synthase component II [Verrucomicrobia bacterium TMED56]
MRLYVIDNYDSFTYNIVQYFGELGAEQKVVRNDAIKINELQLDEYDGLVISPGPCDPDRAGISLHAIEQWAGRIPILGVCLGHQSIGQSFGGKIIGASKLMHGKTSEISHDDQDLFEEMPQGFLATRYHSLVIERETLPECLEITASSEDNEIMGIRHRDLPLWGVQFHPESLATENGIMILKNFLKLC